MQQPFPAIWIAITRRPSRGTPAEVQRRLAISSQASISALMDICLPTSLHASSISSNPVFHSSIPSSLSPPAMPFFKGSRNLASASQSFHQKMNACVLSTGRLGLFSGRLGPSGGGSHEEGSLTVSTLLSRLSVEPWPPRAVVKLVFVALLSTPRAHPLKTCRKSPIRADQHLSSP